MALAPALHVVNLRAADARATRSRSARSSHGPPGARIPRAHGRGIAPPAANREDSLHGNETFAAPWRAASPDESGYASREGHDG